MNSDLLSQLSLEEKALLMSGQDLWSTHPIERLGIPSIYMSDGPHGLRKVDPNVALGESVPATCFPTASAMASSWNTELLYRAGAAMGQECLRHNVQVLLGPGVNIKRSPLGGRNFEYFSEDPLLSGIMAASLIEGLQSKGIGACVKHFAANNQEFERMIGNSLVDERTLREIYLTAFEIVVKEARPYAIMAAYNQVNGTWASESKELLTHILREEWGYEGIVVSDWGAVNHPEKAVAAGLTLEMPDNPLSAPKIIEAVKDGRLAESDLDLMVENLLNIVFLADTHRQADASFNTEEHHELAKEVAAESMVLLKNERDFLPLKAEQLKSLALIGRFAKEPRFQGSGSSRVNASKVDTAFEAFQAALPKEVEIHYAEGYNQEADEVHMQIIKEAAKIASESEAAILFVGLPDEFEAEGSDRSHLQLPKSHTALIKEVLKLQPQTAVVLLNGSAVEMDTWAEDAAAILESWLGGQAAGSALCDIILGKINPSGKLSETFPLKLEHNSSFLNFPGENRKVEYKERIYVGYRFYDTKKLPVLFPFGHGLSYTSFEYSNLAFSDQVVADDDTCRLSFFLKNTGDVKGKEVVQVYVSPPSAYVDRPNQKLAAFDKIELDPGATALVEFILEKRAFSYYDVDLGDWLIDNGRFEIRIGSSSRDIRLCKSLEIVSEKAKPKKRFDQYSTIGEILEHPMGKAYVDEMVKLFGVDPT
ncbi:MAG: glycoside hydrolase family 3 C-terminal domain-containing protein, partial [Bacteroidota bacterium]